MATDAPFDIHTHITNQIAAAIEQGAGDWQMPWRGARGALHRPRNVATGNRYQGVNIVSLWVAAETREFAEPIWGTYRQWQGLGAQVRKGERGSPIVFYKEFENPNAEDGEDASRGNSGWPVKKQPGCEGAR